MGDVIQFAAVVAVVTMAGLGWKWSSAWLHRLRLGRDDEIERLEERIDSLEARLGQGESHERQAIAGSEDAH